MAKKKEVQGRTKNDVVKLRLKDGDKEFEAEATRNHVDELLAAHWVPSTQGASPEEAAPTEPEPKPRKNKAHRRKGKSESQRDKGDENSFDPQSLANRIKESPDASRCRTILNGKACWERIALVLFKAEQPLTSGEVQRTLDALDVRISLPNVSTLLKKKGGQLILDTARTSGAVPKYRLVNTAREWVKGLLTQKHAA